MNKEWIASNSIFRTLGVLVLGLLGLFLLVSTIGVVRGWHESDVALGERPQITVSGMGESQAKPDVGIFTYTVTEEGKTTAEAQTKATTKANEVLAYLKKAGIEEKDIKTVSYNTNPKYEYYDVCPLALGVACRPGSPTLVGYEVSQGIEVTVRDTARAGELLAGVGGFNVAHISGLNFRFDNQEIVLREARKKAIDQAEEKAHALARDLGVRLVRITSFSENGNTPIFYGKTSLEARDMAGSASPVSNPAPQIPTGENNVTSNVTITYEIR